MLPFRAFFYCLEAVQRPVHPSDRVNEPEPVRPEKRPVLFQLRHPLIVGLTTNPERLIQIRRNRLLSLNQAPETDYVDMEAVNAELAFARRMFADNGWPVIDVTRRSIEETALAIVKLYTERSEKAAE